MYKTVLDHRLRRWKAWDHSLLFLLKHQETALLFIKNCKKRINSVKLPGIVFLNKFSKQGILIGRVQNHQWKPLKNVHFRWAQTPAFLKLHRPTRLPRSHGAEAARGRRRVVPGGAGARPEASRNPGQLSYVNSALCCDINMEPFVLDGNWHMLTFRAFFFFLRVSRLRSVK